MPPQEESPPDQTLTTMTSTSLSASYVRVCLLITAIADISASPITVDSDLHFDEGAQHSFITQKVADKMQLQPAEYKNTSVLSFGAPISAPRRIAIIHIHTYPDNLLRSLLALI